VYFLKGITVNTLIPNARALCVCIVLKGTPFEIAYARGACIFKGKLVETIFSTEPKFASLDYYVCVCLPKDWFSLMKVTNALAM
jgi:hypothetical protein